MLPLKTLNYFIFEVIITCMLSAIIFALTKLANVSLLVITMSGVFQLVIEMKLLVRKVSLTNPPAFIFFELPYETLTVT